MQRTGRSAQRIGRAGALVRSSRLDRAFLAVVLAAALASAGAVAPARSEEPPAVANEAGQSTREEIDRLKAKLEEATAGVQFTGFLDVQGSNYRNNPNFFEMGAFELDLAKEVGSHFQVASAIVISDDGTSLGVGFIDFRLYGGIVAPRGRLPLEKGFHVQVGRFDVPFGNDWNYFASKDRAAVTAPLTTQQIMGGGYNDTGVRVFGNAMEFNYAGYVLRGAGTGNAFGGRFGFTPLANPYEIGKEHPAALEIGLSALRDLDENGALEKTTWAVDADARFGAARLRAEYIDDDSRPGAAADMKTVTRGFHVTAEIDLFRESTAPGTLTFRYETLRRSFPDGAGDVTAGPEGRLTRAVAAIGLGFGGVAQLKGEYSRHLAASRAFQDEEGYGRSSYYLQLVMVF